MQIAALKFLGRQPQGPPQGCYLSEPHDLMAAAALVDELPAAYVVKAEELEYLRSVPDLIVDRGVKHPAKGLSRLLLGCDRIPLIDGHFTAIGQLRRSLRTLLTNAVQAGERNLYLIGVADSLFQELGSEAIWHGTGKGPAQTISMNTSSHRPIPQTAGQPPPNVLLDLMGYCEEPPDLSQRYIGESVEAQLVRQLVLRAARSEDTVLILGDSGTGKEVVARAIHEYSVRRSDRFTAVNCGALPRDLVESELFGHEKGSFTGAINEKPGLWEVADKGTLFLDEIGDFPLEHQGKILRALQEGVIRRVGGNKEVRVNARIIAATNRDLFSLVQTGQFREDLYYRLREFLIRTPALRDHPGDIPLLAQFFWGKIVRDETRTLPAEILEELQAYGWPGNARELKTVFTQLRALFDVHQLRVEHLRAVFLLQGQRLLTPPEPTPLRVTGLHQIECLRHLRRVHEVIQAVAVNLRSLWPNRQTDTRTVVGAQASLRFRLSELEILCLEPLLFDTEATFSQVYRFKGKLTYFQGLLDQEVIASINYWEKEGNGELAAVLATLSQQMEELATIGS